MLAVAAQPDVKSSVCGRSRWSASCCTAVRRSSESLQMKLQIGLPTSKRDAYVMLAVVVRPLQAYVEAPHRGMFGCFEEFFEVGCELHPGICLRCRSGRAGTR